MHCSLDTRNSNKQLSVELDAKLNWNGINSTDMDRINNRWNMIDDGLWMMLTWEVKPALASKNKEKKNKGPNCLSDCFIAIKQNVENEVLVKWWNKMACGKLQGGGRC